MKALLHKKARRAARLIKKRKKAVLYVVGAILVLLAVGILFVIDGIQFEIVGGNKDMSAQFGTHPLTAISCENNRSRPFAIMMAADAIARPLSGISSADIVVEMPVLDGGITRFMAVFACQEPQEIGSIRSSRHDFIPLAASFDAMYGHWGGSHFALDILSAGVIDNFDGLTNRGNPYYRKDGAPAPHNGFTSFARLVAAAEKLGYRTEYEGPEYFFTEALPNEQASGATISIEYGGPFTVDYIYSSTTNRYTRFRGGLPENDKASSAPVETSVVAVLFAKSEQIEPDYNDVEVTGEGRLLLFQNGGVVEGVWRKASDPQESPLRFFDSDGEELSFVPGSRWLQYVDIGTSVSWNGTSY